MKNYLFLLAFLFVSATVFAVPQGDGSVDNPYLVADASELNEIRNHPDAHYRLMNDIDLGDWLAENSPEEGSMVSQVLWTATVLPFQVSGSTVLPPTRWVCSAASLAAQSSVWAC